MIWVDVDGVMGFRIGNMECTIIDKIELMRRSDMKKC